MTRRAADSYNPPILESSDTPASPSAPAAGAAAVPPPAARFLESLTAFVETHRPAELTRTADLISDYKLTDKFDFAITRTAKPGVLGRVIQVVLDRLLGKVQLFMLKSLATQERLNFYLFDRLAVLEDRVERLERLLRRETE